MELQGTVRNVVDFGAFVDIGVKQDGLVHISQLSNSFISDPNQVVKLQQKVMVKVVEVDVVRKRISLSMKTQEQVPNSKKQVPKKEEKISKKEEKISNKKTDPQNAFQAKLAELKKKFDE